MWEIDIKNQTVSFTAAVILGIMLCLVYDFFRAKRFVFKSSSVSVFLGDVFFAILSSLIFFIYYLVFTCGEIRSFAYLGAALGFMLCRLTFSKIYFKALRFVFGIFKRFYRSFCKLTQLICLKISVLGGNFEKILKKSVILLKKLLKNVWQMLYTKGYKSAEKPES